MLSVDEVDGRAEFRRFTELPFALFGADPRWAPPVMAYERARLDPRRNPSLEGEQRYLLARRRGRVVGRLLVAGDGRFGCFDCVDEEVGVALLEAAPNAAVGPVSFGDDQDGVLVVGHDVAGVTARQWHPPWAAAALTAAGFLLVDERRTWRLAAAATASAGGDSGVLVGGGDQPSVAGPYGDDRLVFTDIAAVPDLAPDLRTAGVLRAWHLARRARERAWERCVVVRLHGDPALVVPALAAAAAAAGYREVIAPWSPGPRAPETAHGLFRR